MQRIIVSLVLVGLLFNPSASLAADQPPIEAPETVEEAKGFGLQLLQELPNAVKGVWESEVVPLWSKMFNIAKNIWGTYVFPWAHGVWERVLSLFGQEIEKRKPFIEQEFEKEKQQLKEEVEEKLPEETKTLWEHLKGFFGNGKD